MTNHILKKIEQLYGEMVEIRRYLHQHPEVSYQEFKTSQFICDYYEKLGISYQKNVGGNGVIATVIGKHPGKTIALRADFDALPIQDLKDVPYKSKNDGVCHACGHDGHTAILLVLAKVLNECKDELHGTIKFIHQHAEESAPGGAIEMINDNCLDGVDVIFGTHLWTYDKLGTVSTTPGPLMAAPDRFEIEIVGSGGHGGAPHTTKDAIVIASSLVINLQQIASRKISPLEPVVVSVGSIVSDNAFNVIADKVKLTGTVRTFTDETRTLVEQEMIKILKATCALYDATFSFSFDKGYPPVINHEKESHFLLEMAKQNPYISEVKIATPTMAGEDFASYLEHVPGCYFFTGARPLDESKAFDHHHPKFDFEEKAMLIAATTLASAALNYK